MKTANSDKYLTNLLVTDSIARAHYERSRAFHQMWRAVLKAFR